MANNFHITTQREGDAIHLQLNGNFDGSSAMELIFAIGRHGTSAQRIFIDTEKLEVLAPFGSQVFIKRAFLPRTLWQKLIFTGKHGPKLIP